jgi:DNA polymerase (family 10)
VIDKLEVARALREIGELLAFKGENAYRARAYQTGARAVEGVEDLARLVDEQRLTEVRGIGDALARLVAELVLTGKSGLLERLRAEVPPGVLELARVPGLGTQKILTLHSTLGIASIAELKAACLDGRLATVRGFGAKTASRILDGIRRYETSREQLLLYDAQPIAEALLAWVRQNAAVVRVEAAGALRRWQETVTELELVAATDDAPGVLAHFAAFPRFAAVELRDGGGAAGRLPSGLPVELLAVAPDRFAAALLARTGSAAHLARLGERARRAGVSLDSPVESEAAIYARLGLPWLPPEVREDAGELEEAAGFDDLVVEADVQGLVHCHTVFSDGRNTIEEMARAADRMGMRYLTITDHSPSAYYAGGVTIDRLKAQWDEIARVQEQVQVRLLRGTESDILEDGALDYPDAVLERFDVIIASVHGRMKMDEAQMTARLVRAMRQPLFKIWGHALGRLVLRRDPFACRVETVLDAIAESRAAIEINGDPHRLDLEPRWVREARQRGIRFVVSTDAHSVAALGNVRYGVAMARRGRLRRDEVLNALDADAFARAVRPT